MTKKAVKTRLFLTGCLAITFMDIVLKVVKNGVENWAYVRASANGTYEIHVIKHTTTKPFFNSS